MRIFGSNTINLERYAALFRCFLFGLFILLSGCDSSHDNQTIKSIYIENVQDIDKIIADINTYGANAVVIDVRDDFGLLKKGIEVPSNENAIYQENYDLQKIIKTLKDKGIYLIARVVALKDKDITEPDFCIKNEDGSIWQDEEKLSWFSPRDKNVWIYLKEISLSAIKMGFDEVQLDYVRYSSYQDKKDLDQNENCRINAINELISFLCDAIHQAGGKLSVCVFGCTIEGAVDKNDGKKSTKRSSAILGQDFLKIAKQVDFVCPMIYPSHYPDGTPCGIKDPDLHPYEVVCKNMQLTKEMLKNQSVKAIVRPYLQAFTAKWLKNHMNYKKREIYEQIHAVTESDFSQWGLFNMSGKYPLE